MILSRITEFFVDSKISASDCLIFVEQVLLKKVLELKTPATRKLFSAIVQVAKIRPGTIAQGLLVPLSVREGATSSQREIIGRILGQQTLPIFDLSISLLQGLVSDSFSASRFNEFTMSLIQTILDSKVMQQYFSQQEHAARAFLNNTIWPNPLISGRSNDISINPGAQGMGKMDAGAMREEFIVSRLILKIELDIQAPALKKSGKLLQILTTLANKYQPWTKPYKDQLLQIIGSSTNNMMKSIALSAVNKL